MTLRSLENAAAAVAATGGSTNAALHLPAIAHEAGLRFGMAEVGVVFDRTPLLADLKPGGRFWARDLHEVGGVPTVLRAMLEAGVLHGECPTIDGRTIGEIAAAARAPDGAVVRRAATPISPTGGVVVLRGNLAPDGAMLKVAGLKRLVHEGPARVFESEEAAVEAVRAGAYAAGDVHGHPQRRPARRPGHARDAGGDRADLRPGHGRERRPAHRWPVLRRHARHVHRPCRAGGVRGRSAGAGAGGRRHPDRRRRTDDRPPRGGRGIGGPAIRLVGQATRRLPPGLAKYARLVGPAHLGAVTH